MTYLASKLITKSWNLSGIVPKGLNTVSGDKMSEGLDLLNSLIASKSMNIRLIPYFRKYDFTAVVGQEKYFIENLVMVETFTFNIGTVRYSTREQSRKQYFGTPRANNIQSLPYQWHTERTKGGTDLYVYFLPDTTYPFSIFGKFGFDAVEKDTDLEGIYDEFYIEYMRYALAELMCEEYNIAFQPGSITKLKEYEDILQDLSPPDLSLQKVSTFGQRQFLNYGLTNLSDGWIPTGRGF